MRENGLHYDHETTPDAIHVTKRVSFTVCGFPWAFNVKVPKRIYDTLTSADWDRTIEDGKNHCYELIARHFFLGDDSTRVTIEKALHVRIANRLHERFIDHKQRAGDEAWARPDTMKRGRVLLQ